MSRGGRRHGSGRPRGSKAPRTVMVEQVRQELISQILDYWQPLIQTKIRLALGDYYIEKINNKGQKLVYRVKPDGKSINDLIEYVVGKPQQTIDNNINGTLTSPAIDQLTLTMRQILDTKNT